MTIPRRPAKPDAGDAGTDPEPRRRRRSRRKATGAAADAGTGTGTGPVPGDAGDPAADLALMAELASRAAGNLAGLADLAEAEDAAGAPGCGPGGVRRIAVVVADGREPAISTVLDKLRHKVDEVVVVDGGSTPRTRAEIEVWLAGQDHRCRLLTLDENENDDENDDEDSGNDGSARRRGGERRRSPGAPTAVHVALTDLRRRLAAGELDSEDLVLTAGDGGRHDLDVLDDLHRQVVEQDLDALLVRRDPSSHPAPARLGRHLLSAWATLWAGGVRLHDARSPYRILRLGPLVHALDHYDGRRRSEAVEVAVVLSRLRYAVRNDVLVEVPAAGTGPLGLLVDLLVDLVAIPRVAVRVTVRREKPRPAPSLLPPVAVCVALAAGPALVGRALVRAAARRRRHRRSFPPRCVVSRQR
jgi:hypothetical protein